MSEPIFVLARVKKINTNGKRKAESFELEPLGVVELYPPAKHEGEKVPARSPDSFVAES